MRGWIVACFAVVTLLTQVAASPTPTPPAPSPTVDPNQAILLNQVRQKLSSGLADALAVQTDLRGSFHANLTEQQLVTVRVVAANQRIAELDAEILRLQRKVTMTKVRIEKERAQIGALARTMYAQPDSVLLVLTQARSLSDALKRGSDLLIAGRRAHDIKVQLDQDLKQLQADQAKAQTDRDQQAQKRLELQGLNEQLTILQTKDQRIGDELQAKMSAIQAELAIVGTQSPDVAALLQARLLADTAAISAEARQATMEHVQLLVTVHAKSPGADAIFPAGLARAGLAWPIANAVLTQGFGPSPYAFEPPYGAYAHFHTGLDLAGPYDTPVVAAADGVVTLVGRDPWGYGNYIVISHSGEISTLYGHLDAVMVASGEPVTQLQQIGTEGSSGHSTGPHLHFEVRLNGVITDPLPYLPPLTT